MRSTRRKPSPWSAKRRVKERLEISGNYYFVIGQWDKSTDTFQLYASTYPRDGAPYGALSNLYILTGQWDNALRADQEYVRLVPRQPFAYSRLAFDYIRLGQFEEAKAVAKRGLALDSDYPVIHEYLLQLAFTEGDHSAAERESRWFLDKPEQTDSLSYEALNAYALGQRREAKKLYDGELELLQQRKLANRAAQAGAADGFRDALLGNCQGALLESSRRCPAYPYPNILIALALCGQISKAQPLAAEILKRPPQDPRWNLRQLPTIRAALALGHNRPDKAIELLQTVAPYERSYPLAIYLRGLAYLQLHRSSEAAVEFQKILANKGAYWMGPGPIYPLSYLGLARAAAMSGDTAKSKKAYQDLFALWKDADPDLLPLVQARKEYAALR